MRTMNFLENLPEPSKEEYFEKIAESGDIRIERIISEGHKSPDNFWYDQERNEFVMIIKGSALLEFENERTIGMKEGDYIIIPARKRHRVAATSDKEKTVWLAVHY